VPVVPVAFVATPEEVDSQPAFSLTDVSGGPESEPATAVRFAATAETFVALFEAASEPPLTLRHGDGEDVYLDECVELFLASTSEPFAYREFVVNPLGALYTADITNPGESRATWRVARGGRPAGVSIGVTGEAAEGPATEWIRWRCRMALPWAILPSGRRPSPGEERRANAYRIARGRSTRFLALSPTLRSNPPDFHVPSRFAAFVFGAAPS
jgi:hypothetical protein